MKRKRRKRKKKERWNNKTQVWWWSLTLHQAVSKNILMATELIKWQPALIITPAWKLISICISYISLKFLKFKFAFFSWPKQRKKICFVSIKQTSSLQLLRPKQVNNEEGTPHSQRDKSLKIPMLLTKATDKSGRCRWPESDEHYSFLLDAEKPWLTEPVPSNRSVLQTPWGRSHP